MRDESEELNQEPRPAARWRLYEAMKNQWIDQHPEASPAEIDAATAEILRLLDL